MHENHKNLKANDKNNITADAKVNVNAKDDVYFDAKVDDIYKTDDVDKLILKTRITNLENELLRKTMYFKRKNWDRICQLASKTRNSKTAVINLIIEYALNHMTIE